MDQRFENRGNCGFSLVETLAVVAILVILLSISAVAAAYYRDYLKITELDTEKKRVSLSIRALLEASDEESAPAEQADSDVVYEAGPSEE